MISSILSIVVINDKLTRVGYTKNDKLIFLFNLVLIQCMFCMIMLIFPDFRTNVLEILYQSGNGNPLTLQNRVYGIMHNYT